MAQSPKSNIETGNALAQGNTALYKRSKAVIMTKL